MKLLNYLILPLLFILTCSNIQAQLLDGSIAPDFTVTDINGNTHHLYEYLDEGKVVILDFSRTWCDPCWTYVTTGALEEVYEEFGPDGTDEIMVLFIEGDATTNEDDLNGLTPASDGNWVEAINYPIIDGSDGVATESLYEVVNWPTIYTVYPNRVVVQSKTVPAETHIELAQPENYLLPGGTNNAGVFDLTPYNLICADEFIPTFNIQNLGSADLNSLDVELIVNGETIQSFTWTGSVDSYDFTEIVFDPVEVGESNAITINVSNPNGMPDEGTDPNSITLDVFVPNLQEDGEMTLTIYPDQFVNELTVELLGLDGVAIASYSGTTDFQPFTPFTLDVLNLITQSGCHEIRLYDSIGDGISLGGSVELTLNGEVLYDDETFVIGDIDPNPNSIRDVRIPFRVIVSPENAIDFGVASSLTVVDQLGCGQALEEVEASIYNIGSNPITQATTVLSIDGTVIQSVEWNGNLNQGESANVFFNDVDVSGYGDLIVLELSTSSSSAIDVAQENNVLTTGINLPKKSEGAIDFSITTDKWPEEISFELRNEEGVVVFSNEDFGSLSCETTYSEIFDFPLGCYEFEVSDSEGDGLLSGAVVTGSNNCTIGDPNFAIGAIFLRTAEGEVFFSDINYGSGTVIPFEIVEPPVLQASILPNDITTNGAISTYTATAMANADDAYFIWEIFDETGTNAVAAGNSANINADFEVNGTYTIELTVTGFEDQEVIVTETFEITETVNSGIEDLAINELQLFPVPTSNQLNVNLNLDRDQLLKISVSNILGETIETNQSHYNSGDNTIQINTTNYSSGLYFLNIETKVGRISQKFTVAK